LFSVFCYAQAMRNTIWLLLAVIGVLVFGVGVLVGQQAQRSKFDTYLRPAADSGGR
jgi:hypothetical protein